MDLTFWVEHWPQLAAFGGYVAGAFLVSRLFKWALRRVMGAFTARSQTTLDDRIVAAAARPGAWALFLLGLKLAVEYLGGAVPGITGLSGWRPLELGLKAATVVVIAFLGQRILNAVLDWYVQEVSSRTESTWDDEILPLVKKFTGVLLVFIALSIILDLYGVNITALVTTAGVASLAVAMAAQETLANMIAGFTIMVDRPFKVGDLVELNDGKAGEVVELGLRSTKIKLFDGNALVIPNKDISGTRLINYALPNERRAIRATIGVSYQTDVEKARQILLEVMSQHPDVLQDPAPGVWLNDFGPHSLNLLLVCWVESYKIWFKTRHELFMEILRRFRAEGIEIPFPQQDVHLFYHRRPAAAGKESAGWN